MVVTTRMLNTFITVWLASILFHEGQTFNNIHTHVGTYVDHIDVYRIKKHIPIFSLIYTCIYVSQLVTNGSKFSMLIDAFVLHFGDLKTEKLNYNFSYRF